MKPSFVLIFCSLGLSSLLGCLSDLSVASNDAGAGGSAGSNAGGMGGTAGSGGAPACESGFFCAGTLNDGWEGFVRAHFAEYGTTPVPMCPDGSAPMVYYAEPATDTICDECSCTYSGATCSVPRMQCYWNGPNCGSAVDYTTDPNNTNCDVNLPTAAGVNSACKIVGPSYVLGTGTCTASLGAVKNPPFIREIHLCAAQPFADCTGGGQCIASVSGDYSSSICIHRANAESCPPGFELETQLFDSANDGRTCTDCQCDPNTVTCMGGGHDVFDLESCGGMKKTITQDLGCTGVGA